jgi:hypothetical protein
VSGHSVRKKLLNLSLILTSLIGYLEWGQGQSVFLFQAEAEMFARALRDPGDVVHPFTLLPVLGQAMLVGTLFQTIPGRVLTYAGIAGIGLLLAFMFLIGLIALNGKIVASTAPFLALAVVTIREHRAGG